MPGGAHARGINKSIYKRQRRVSPNLYHKDGRRRRKIWKKWEPLPRSQTFEGWTRRTRILYLYIINTGGDTDGKKGVGGWDVKHPGNGKRSVNAFGDFSLSLVSLRLISVWQLSWKDVHHLIWIYQLYVKRLSRASQTDRDSLPTDRKSSD